MDFLFLDGEGGLQGRRESKTEERKKGRISVTGWIFELRDH